MELELPKDFSEFLSLLNEHNVEYLLIGGYAVSIHGHIRATDDMDVYVGPSRTNAERVVAAIRAFGFDVPKLNADLVLMPRKIIRMGVPPLRIEIMAEIDGVEFEGCRKRAMEVELDGNVLPVISLKDLRANKLASGRHKDLDDLENLPEK